MEQSEASRSWKNESFKKKKNEQDNEYIMCRPTLHLFIIFIYYLLLSFNRYRQSTSLKKIYTFLVFI